jgi:hypothetical protein
VAIFFRAPGRRGIYKKPLELTQRPTNPYMSWVTPPTGSKRKGFDTLFALTTWHLLKEQNTRVFREAEAPPHLLLRAIRQEGAIGSARSYSLRLSI